MFPLLMPLLLLTLPPALPANKTLKLHILDSNPIKQQFSEPILIWELNIINVNVNGYPFLFNLIFSRVNNFFQYSLNIASTYFIYDERHTFLKGQDVWVYDRNCS